MLGPRIGSTTPHPHAQSLLTYTPVQDAVARHDMHALERLLKGNVHPDVLLESLDKACQDKSCPLAIKLALLGHQRADRRRALDLAVRNGDVELAQEMVKQGCLPERTQLRSDNPAMRVLLPRARRRALLYPATADRSRDTDLDRALQADDVDAARALLGQRTGDASVRKAWSDAVTNNRLDILRALLLLGMADEDPGFRLDEDPRMTIQDVHIRAVMKEIPYRSPKRRELKNFNIEGAKNTCRHLVQYVQNVLTANPADKSFFQTLSNKTDIDGKIEISEEEIRRVVCLASEVHMESSRMFGARIADQLETMQRTGKDTQLIVVRTVNHVISVQLRTRTDGTGRKIRAFDYVAKVYDPNCTTTHVRAASGNLEAFDPLEFHSFIGSKELEQQYFEGSQGVVMMYIRPPADELQADIGAPAAVPRGRTLTSLRDGITIDPTVMHLLLDAGFAGNLRSLKHEIAGRPESEQLALLAAQRPHIAPGLYCALQNGHADAIRAFGELLVLVAEPHRDALLAARRIDGVPGFCPALEHGHTDAIQAFGELLLLVAEVHRVDLLFARDSKGVPGLHLTLQNGHASAIRAFGDLLSLVDAVHHLDLVAAKTADGTPGLFMALQNGHADAIRAYGQLLSLVPEAQRLELLAAVRADGVSGLAMALRDGHAGAVRAYGELLPLIPEAQRAPLVAAVGTLGVVWAMTYGRAEAIRAYGEVLTRIPEDQRADLLTAKLDPNAPPALFFAVLAGYADAVTAFDELLPLIPEAQRAAVYVDILRTTTGQHYGAVQAQSSRLLTAPTWSPILRSALRNGYGEVLDEMDALLPMLPADQRKELMAARAGDGTPGLLMALQHGHADVIRKFGALLSHLPADGRADLILAVEAAAGDSSLVSALQQGHAEAARAFGELLLPLLTEAQRADLLTKGARVLGDAMRRGDPAVVDAYCDLCRTVAPGLNAEQKAALRKEIKHQQRPRSGIAWCNYRHYDRWKKDYPASYQRFKDMKTALGTDPSG